MHERLLRSLRTTLYTLVGRAVLYAEHSNTGGQVIWLRAERRIIFSQAKGSIPFNHAF